MLRNAKAKALSEIFFMIGLVKPLLYLVNPVLPECIGGNKGIKGSLVREQSLQQVAKLGLRLNNLTFGSGSSSLEASKIAICYGG